MKQALLDLAAIVLILAAPIPLVLALALRLELAPHAYLLGWALMWAWEALILREREQGLWGCALFLVWWVFPPFMLYVALREARISWRETKD